MEVQVTYGDHELIFVADGYYALRVLIKVTDTGIECVSAEYGEFNEATKEFTKVGDASCNACTTRENGVCISGFTITGYLKEKEVAPPPEEKPRALEEWIQMKGGPSAITSSDVYEIIDAYLGLIDLGFTVTSSDVYTVIDCYLGLITALSPSLSARLAEELEQVSGKKLIDKILDDLRKVRW